MCDCTERIKKNRNRIVSEAVKGEVIRSLISRIKEQDVVVMRDGRVHFTFRFEIDERVASIAHEVVDKVIELLERGKI